MPRDNQPREPDDLVEHVRENSTIHINVGQDFIAVTEDKTRLSLKKNLDQQTGSWDRVLAIAGLSAALGVALLTADFRSPLIPGESWKTLFVVAFVLSLAWLLWEGTRAAFAPSTDEVIENVVAELKQASPSHSRAAEATQRIGPYTVTLPLKLDKDQAERLQGEAASAIEDFYRLMNAEPAAPVDSPAGERDGGS